MRNLPCTRIKLDEIWSYIYAKRKNVDAAKSHPRALATSGPGSRCARTPSHRVGDRTYNTALAFVPDLASRASNRVQITSDGHQPYMMVVPSSFDVEVDFAQQLGKGAPTTTGRTGR